MIIDFHTHAFPDKIAERAMINLEQNIVDIQSKSYPARGRGTVDSLLEHMRGGGVDISVVLPIATTVKQSASINRFAREINGKNGIISFGSLHPMQPDWEETLEEIKESGLKGIKLHLEYQQVYLTSPEVVRILKKAEELGLYTVFHAGRDIGMPEPVHCKPECLRQILDHVKGDKIIAAHMGGWQSWDEVEKYLVGTPIMFDTSYVRGFISPEQFKRIVRNHGSEKIVFGTDMPWQAPREAVEFIESVGLTDEELQNIYFKNAVRILNL